MTKYIVDDIGSVVSRMRPIDSSYGTDMTDYISSIGQNANLPLMPYYIYGHRLEIANRLKEKDQDKVFKYQKYPLIALRMDIQEVVTKGIIDVTLNLAILSFTERKYNAEERYENVFKPILYPLYNRFMDELFKSGLFFWQNDSKTPDHTKIDRPYWGTEGNEGNVKHIFNDPLDAIEILNLKISKNFKNC